MDIENHLIQRLEPCTFYLIEDSPARNHLHKSHTIHGHSVLAG